MAFAILVTFPIVAMLGFPFSDAGLVLGAQTGNGIRVLFFECGDFGTPLGALLSPLLFAQSADFYFLELAEIGAIDLAVATLQPAHGRLGDCVVSNRSGRYFRFDVHNGCHRYQGICRCSRFSRAVGFHWTPFRRGRGHEETHRVTRKSGG
jgi:hypothetical protein